MNTHRDPVNLSDRPPVVRTRAAGAADRLIELEPPGQRLRVAIVHDYLTQRGGAERVVLALHRAFPRAPIYTSLYAPDATFPEFQKADVRASRLQAVGARGLYPLLPLYPAVFEGMRLSGYDVVISSSSGWAHGVEVEDGLHVVYCHNPARWLYQTDEYLGPGGPAPAWSRSLLSPVLDRLRRWDQRVAARPDVYVANSRTVAARIDEAYGRSAEVVHPPVDTQRIRAGQPAMAATSVPREPYHLVIARLLPYKNVDLVVEACRRLGRRLVVVGNGPAREQLATLGRGQVDFRRGIPDAELTALLRGCTSLVQAGEEDFGIVPLEANAAGRPVVALARGGARETVRHGSTGILFDEPSVASLTAALRQVEQTTWDTDTLTSHARNFDETRFQVEIELLIDRELGLRRTGSVELEQQAV